MLHFPNINPDLNKQRPEVYMDHRDAGRYWNDNAEGWTQLARAWHDTARDWVNTPAFLAMLPNVSGKHGLDIGCGAYASGQRGRVW
tara:strand:- start:209 stop:466 length:258 start_codon:yes stop_codon:yes gene_type:complete